jgi:hypothetical protein
LAPAAGVVTHAVDEGRVGRTHFSRTKTWDGIV